MMKWNNKIIVALLFMLLGCSINLSYAGLEDIKRYDPISKTCRTLGFDSFWGGKGRQLFEQKCQTCHTRKNNAKAPFLHSESKSSRGWSRVFFKRYPKCAKTGAWKITPDEALLINDYLFRYSANTYNANVAG